MSTVPLRVTVVDAGLDPAANVGRRDQRVAATSRGEALGVNTLAVARRCRLRLCSSREVCFLDSSTRAWSTGVGPPYLGQAAPEW